jgi:hypothetical protein
MGLRGESDERSEEGDWTMCGARSEGFSDERSENQDVVERSEKASQVRMSGARNSFRARRRARENTLE